MKGKAKLPDNYFDKFSQTSVRIRPFDPKSLQIAQEVINKLKLLITNSNPLILLRGSTLFQISGRGDIEIGIYLEDSNWFDVLKALTNHYKGINILKENLAVWCYHYKSCEIDIVAMRGEEAKEDQALHKYLKNNRKLLQEYEKLKKKYSYSEREYQKQKDIFLRKIVEMITD